MTSTIEKQIPETPQERYRVQGRISTIGIRRFLSDVALSAERELNINASVHKQAVFP